MQDVRDFCKFALVQHTAKKKKYIYIIFPPWHISIAFVPFGNIWLYYNEFSSMLSPSAQKNPWSNTIKADDHRTIYLTHITFNNIPSSPNAKKLALTKLCYVFCFKGSDECDVWFHISTPQCTYDSIDEQCNLCMIPYINNAMHDLRIDVWSPYVLGSICTRIPKLGLHRQIVQRCCSKGGKENWSNVAMDCMCCSSWAEFNSCCREVFCKRASLVLPWVVVL